MYNNDGQQNMREMELELEIQLLERKKQLLAERRTRLENGNPHRPSHPQPHSERPNPWIMQNTFNSSSDFQNMSMSPQHGSGGYGESSGNYGRNSGPFAHSSGNAGHGSGSYRRSSEKRARAFEGPHHSIQRPNLPLSSSFKWGTPRFMIKPPTQSVQPFNHPKPPPRPNHKPRQAPIHHSNQPRFHPSKQPQFQPSREPQYHKSKQPQFHTFKQILFQTAKEPQNPNTPKQYKIPTPKKLQRPAPYPQARAAPTTVLQNPNFPPLKNSDVPVKLPGPTYSRLQTTVGVLLSELKNNRHLFPEVEFEDQTFSINVKNKLRSRLLEVLGNRDFSKVGDLCNMYRAKYSKDSDRGTLLGLWKRLGMEPLSVDRVVQVPVKTTPPLQLNKQITTIVHANLKTPAGTSTATT